MAPIFTGFRFGFGSGSGSGSGAAIVSGGTISVPGNGYVYHTFTYPNTDNFVVNNTSIVADILIVAGGGGGGGGYYTGGGGAGGVVHGSNITVPVGTYPITVGGGGTAGSGVPNTFVAGYNGGSSSFNTVTALGGGAGGSGPGATVGDTGQPGPPYDKGYPGGSGGGSPLYASASNGTAVTQPVPVDYFAYGNNGGTGNGAGGGGAGAAGAATPAGNGGSGYPFPQFPGSIIPILIPVVPKMGPNGTYYGGGGGGALPGANPPPLGGYGGGGDGRPGPAQTVNDATNHLGGGGGGFGNGNPAPPPNAMPGGNGGSGIVIVRYAA